MNEIGKEINNKSYCLCMGVCISSDEPSADSGGNGGVTEDTLSLNVDCTLTLDGSRICRNSVST